MLQSEPNQVQRLLKATDVARVLNVSRALAYRLIQNGDIPVIRINRAVRVEPSDLKAFIIKSRNALDDEK